MIRELFRGIQQINGTNKILLGASIALNVFKLFQLPMAIGYGIYSGFIVGINADVNNKTVLQAASDAANTSLGRLPNETLKEVLKKLFRKFIKKIATTPIHILVVQICISLICKITPNPLVFLGGAIGFVPLTAVATVAEKSAKVLIASVLAGTKCIAIKAINCFKNLELARHRAHYSVLNTSDGPPLGYAWRRPMATRQLESPTNDAFSSSMVAVPTSRSSLVATRHCQRDTMGGYLQVL